MPIFTKNKKNILFIHIPKCAGSSIEDAFKKNGYSISYLDRSGKTTLNHLRECSPQHMDSKQLESIFNLSKFDEIFTIVREPIARLKSEIGMRLRERYNGTEQQTDTWIKDTLLKYNANNYIFDNHIKPQSEFIVAGTDVFKFEDGVNNIIKAIDSKYKLGFEFFENVHVFDRKEISGYSSSEICISEHSTRLIEDFYNQDFVRFYK